MLRVWMRDQGLEDDGVVPGPSKGERWRSPRGCMCCRDRASRETRPARSMAMRREVRA